MSKWLRRIRGAIGMGLIWAVAWSAAGIVVAAAFRFNADAPFPIVFGVLGFAAGVVFSAMLTLTEGRRHFDQFSVRRFAGWGAVGGLLLAGAFSRMASLGVGDALMLLPTFALASAVCASGSLAVARYAANRALPGSRADLTDAELTDREKQKLL